MQYSLLNACNARCAYCNCPARENPRLSLSEHRALLSGIARLGTARVKFLGGEPLLEADLGALVDAARAGGMRTAIVTNGFLVPERLDVVRRIDEVVISLDGSEPVHDAQRGAGSWRRAMRGIEACAEEGLDFFLSAVLTRKSAGDIDWLIALARRLGVMVNFQIPQVNPEMYGPGAREWMPTPEDIRDTIGRIVAAKKAGAPILFSTRSYRRTLGWPDFAVERVERPGRTSPCTAGRYFLQIEPNGDVYPCVLHIGSFSPKNALRDGLEEAWRHAQSHGCFSCYNTWLNENRAVFDLSPSVLRNFWSNYMRPGRPSRRKPPA